MSWLLRKLRKKSLYKQNSHCLYCEKNLSYEEATVDHIIPVSRFGVHKPVNIVISCVKCNRKKGNCNFLTFIQYCDWSKEKRDQCLKRYHDALVSHLAYSVLNDYKVPREQIEITVDLFNRAKEYLKAKGEFNLSFYSLPTYLNNFDINQPTTFEYIKKYCKHLLQIINDPYKG